MQHPELSPKFWEFLGPLGVQVFFSLSGFLIGRILVDLADHADFSKWLRFMARRWLRTLPLYWVILSILVLLSSDGSDMHRDYLRLLTLTQNIVSTPTETFGVAWSLAVEEIFYLTFSALMFVAIGFFGSRAVWLTALLFLVVPAGARVWLELHGGGYPDRTVFLSLDGIAWGIVLALVHRHPLILRQKSQHIALTSVALIAFAYRGLWRPMDFSLLAVGCTLTLILALRQKSLGYITRPSKLIARYSYGLYLAHIPVFLVVTQIENEAIRLSAYGLSLSVTVFVLNRVVEGPFMNIRPKQFTRTTSALESS
jgi:peptidoglycan/LPS O-acetylase OafA/YrhL